MTPHDVFYRDDQGRPWESQPNPIPMPDGPTHSCRPLDTKYETRPAKGRKCKVDDGNPEAILKQAR